MKYEFFANSIVISNEKNQYPKDYKSKDELETLLNGKEHCHVLDVCSIVKVYVILSTAQKISTNKVPTAAQALSRQISGCKIASNILWISV